MRYGRIFFVAVLLICLFETARLWSISPDQMAAHFNIQGAPDRFVSKAEFFWFQSQSILVVILVSLPLQVLFRIVPSNMINMPNREYWLAPERRTDTIDRLNSFGSTLFAVILVITQAGFEISVYANLQTPIVFNAGLMFAVMAVSFVLIGLLLIQLVLSFRMPAANKELQS